MNVVALAKIVTCLCDICLSLLICFGNYDMFLIMQMNLTCRSFWRTSNDSLEEEPEAPKFRDIVMKERASEEYKENGRSISRDEDHLGHEKSSKMKNSMMRLPKKERGLRHTLVMWHCWATSLMQSLPTMKK